MKLKLLPLLIIGGVGFALYKATSAQAQPTVPVTRTSSGIELAGVTIPSRVHLTRTDVLVARALINQSIRYIQPNGTATAKNPGVPRYLDVGALTPSQRVDALQSALNEMDYDLHYGDTPQPTLFNTLMGDAGN